MTGRRFSGGIGWSRSFVIVRGAERAVDFLDLITTVDMPWFVVTRFDGIYQYVFTREELLEWFRNLEPGTIEVTSLETALDLHEEDQSTPVGALWQRLPDIDLNWRPNARKASVRRYVRVNEDRKPVAIGGSDVEVQILPRLRQPILQYAPLEGGAPIFELPAEDDSLLMPISGLPDEDYSRRVPMSAEPVYEEPRGDGIDEGTAPLRYPSIEMEGAAHAGARVCISVDLRRSPTDHTAGGAVDLGSLDADWNSLDVMVTLQSAEIAFDGEGRGVVTIHRNADSALARIHGRVRDDLPPGRPIAIGAAFYHLTRFCGMAFRQFREGEDIPAQTAQVRVAIGAASPDLTVQILLADINNPSKPFWVLQVGERFEGLPGKLAEGSDLGADPATYARGLYTHFSTLKPGEHIRTINGFGDDLWRKAPQAFKDTYWAMWDHYQRPLSIQFVTDEPSIAWELMRPSRGAQIHPIIAVKHRVARWIAEFDGHMRDHFVDGDRYTIAPHYRSASRSLSRAEQESDMLQKKYRAKRVGGEYQQVLRLLESTPSPPAALLHFAGHGSFASSLSSIQLEDGLLNALEITLDKVHFGAGGHPLVVFNACETGGTGAALGTVGGWAAAFLRCKFGGFIAPLWSVEDDDAEAVLGELMAGAIDDREPLAEVMRGIRERHGDASPTYYSYLYYGDVMASFRAP